MCRSLFTHWGSANWRGLTFVWFSQWFCYQLVDRSNAPHYVHLHLALKLFTLVSQCKINRRLLCQDKLQSYSFHILQNTLGGWHTIRVCLSAFFRTLLSWLLLSGVQQVHQTRSKSPLQSPSTTMAAVANLPPPLRRFLIWEPGWRDSGERWTSWAAWWWMGPPPK